MKSRFLEENEIEKLLQAVGDTYLLPLLVSLETGLRIGDIVALRCTQLKKDGLHYKAKKTGKKGIAQISDKTRKLLNKSGEWLFPSPYLSNQHLTRQAVWARIKKAGDIAGLNKNGLSPHSMRKVFAVELYRKKGFRAVQEALQHTYASTTEIYTFSDWSTGANALLPLQRKDLQLIVKMVLEAIGKETEPKTGAQKPTKDFAGGVGATKPQAERKKRAQPNPIDKKAKL